LPCVILEIGKQLGENMSRQEKIELLMKPIQAQLNVLVNDPNCEFTPSQLMEQHDEIKTRYEGMTDMQLTNIVMMNF